MMTIGLTGSIATGKSTTARMLSAQGVPVFDSDDAVHELYSTGGGAVAAIAELAPETVPNGYVDRGRLSDAVRKDAALLPRIEAIVHPLVRGAQERFRKAAASAGAPFAVLDVPLLFETGRQDEVDRIVLVTCPPDMQKQRALQRPGMTEDKLAFMLSRQIPDEHKRAEADFVVDTSGSLDDTARQIQAIVAILRQQAGERSNA